MVIRLRKFAFFYHWSIVQNLSCSQKIALSINYQFCCKHFSVYSYTREIIRNSRIPLISPKKLFLFLKVEISYNHMYFFYSIFIRENNSEEKKNIHKRACKQGAIAHYVDKLHPLSLSLCAIYIRILVTHHVRSSRFIISQSISDRQVYTIYSRQPSWLKYTSTYILSVPIENFQSALLALLQLYDRLTCTDRLDFVDGFIEIAIFLWNRQCFKVPWLYLSNDFEY